VLFEMLAGHPLRKVDHATSAEDAIGLPIPWNKLRIGVDDELRAILVRMLAKNPAERFDHADEVAHALEEYIYRDGYGPTIQTIEAYLRQEFPDLYQFPDRLCEPTPTDFSTVTLPRLN
jgi:serine/threonine protein kinase